VPPSALRTGGPSRRIILLAVVAVLGTGVFSCAQVGTLLTREDPLQKADAILVLAGTRMLRPLEAADLFREGYAPLIVLTREQQEAEVYQTIERRGVRFASDADRTREVFLAMGIPTGALLVPDRGHDSTADEAVTLRTLATGHRWRRVIVVTSRFHLTRAGFAMRRELKGTGTEVVMRASRYDPLQPDRWWTRRGEIRWVLAELPKLIAYLLGLRA
jgi:uncharacterized SAM-binding protein YcdF (DUF218 family)